VVVIYLITPDVLAVWLHLIQLIKVKTQQLIVSSKSFIYNNTFWIDKCIILEIGLPNTKQITKNKPHHLKQTAIGRFVSTSFNSNIYTMNNYLWQDGVLRNILKFVWIEKGKKLINNTFRRITTRLIITAISFITSPLVTVTNRTQIIDGINTRTVLKSCLFTTV